MKKWLKGIGITLVSILALLLILPFAFKGKIVEKVDQAVNQSLNAKVGFNHDVSLSLLRNFPNLSVGIDDVSIVGIDSFANDTLLASKNIRLVVDI
ncbi:MAG: AsmA family protein, partial [Bacteroidota bacterium]